MYIKGHGIEAKRLDLLKYVEPETWHWQSIWVELATEDHDTFAIDHERMFIVSDLSDFNTSVYQLQIYGVLTIFWSPSLSLSTCICLPPMDKATASAARARMARTF